MKIKLDKSAVCPMRAHPDDAGLDIYAPSDLTTIAIDAGGSAVIDTGVHVEIPRGYVGMLKSKSGLNVKHGIISDGVVDEGYDGEIVVKLYNLTSKPVHLPRGAKITQLCVMPVLYPRYKQVESIRAGSRGSHGFGSTETITGGERL